MLNGKILLCDECGHLMQRVSPDDIAFDNTPHGWSNYKTAEGHVCNTCSNARWRQLWEQNDPCGECRDEPCKKGGECWYTPSYGTWWPYETYYADRVVGSEKLLPKGQMTLDELDEAVS